MSDSSLPQPPGASSPDQRLTDRVIARVKAARRHRRSTDGDRRALRRVFLDFGESYRSYRRRTGEPIAPEVRDAALRFRRELDLVSLVSVAATLERLDHDLVG